MLPDNIQLCPPQLSLLLTHENVPENGRLLVVEGVA
jgi:hypothetical protein